MTRSLHFNFLQIAALCSSIMLSSSIAHAQQQAIFKVNCDSGSDAEISTKLVLEQDPYGPEYFTNDYSTTLIGKMRDNTPVRVGVVLQKTDSGVGLCSSQISLGDRRNPGPSATLAIAQTKCPLLSDFTATIFESLVLRSDHTGVKCRFSSLRFE